MRMALNCLFLFILLLLQLFAGFFVVVSSLPNGLGWLHHIDLLYYSFHSLMANEFHARDIGCTPEEACVFKTGDEVLDNYSVDNNMKGPFAAVCASFFVGFMIIAYIAMAFIHKEKR